MLKYDPVCIWHNTFVIHITGEEAVNIYCLVWSPSNAILSTLILPLAACSGKRQSIDPMFIRPSRLAYTPTDSPGPAPTQQANTLLPELGRPTQSCFNLFRCHWCLACVDIWHADSLAICRPSGCTVESGVVVVVVGVGVCNRSKVRTTKCTCLFFGVSVGLDLARCAQKEFLICQSSRSRATYRRPSLDGF